VQRYLRQVFLMYIDENENKCGYKA